MIIFILITLVVTAVIIVATKQLYDSGEEVPLFGTLDEDDVSMFVVFALIPFVNLVFLIAASFLFLANFIRDKIL